jgi:hypothetical protein
MALSDGCCVLVMTAAAGHGFLLLVLWHASQALTRLWQSNAAVIAAF